MRQQDLQYFLEVCENLSLTRAAERIGISQPSLSASMKRLEKEVGVQLLNRSKTGVTLTPGGQRLWHQSKNLISLWDEVKQSVYDAHHHIEGKLIFGCHAMVGLYHVPDALSKLLIDNPKLNIEMKHGLSREINEGIISCKIDIGIVVNPIRHPDLIILPLRADKIGLWHHKELKDSHNRNLTLLCDQHLVQSATLIKKLKKKGWHINRVIESQSLELIARLACQKVGVAIIPESIALAQASQVLQQLYPSLYYPDELCLVYRHENRFIRSIQAIKECLIKTPSS
jgi:DNA-binding transcriptional LysR family regulator